MNLETNKPPVSPLLVLTIGVIGTSTGAIFVRLAEAPALVTAAYRLGIAVAVLAPLAVWKHGAELKGLTKRDLGLAALSGFFLALHFATWIASLDYTAVANSTVLVNTIPIWVGLLAPLLLRERLKRSTLIGIVFSVAGAAVIGAEGFKLGGDTLRGDGLALAGGFFAAFYIIIGRSLRPRLSLLSYVSVCYGSAAVFLWIMVLGLRLPLTGYELETWGAFLGLALVSQGLGHTSYNWALKWFSAGAVSVALLGEPIGSTILAYFLLGETLTWTKALGGTLILYGIYRAAR